MSISSLQDAKWLNVNVNNINCNELNANDVQFENLQIDNLTVNEDLNVNGVLGIGTGATAYEFPTNIGANNQVLSVVGPNQLGFTNTGGSGTTYTASLPLQISPNNDISLYPLAKVNNAYVSDSTGNFVASDVIVSINNTDNNIIVDNSDNEITLNLSSNLVSTGDQNAIEVNYINNSYQVKFPDDGIIYSGDMTLNTDGEFKIENSSNQLTIITGEGLSQSTMNNIYPIDGSIGQVLTMSDNGLVTWTSITPKGSLAEGANINLNTDPISDITTISLIDNINVSGITIADINYTTIISSDGITLPTMSNPFPQDGISGQILSTNGMNTLSWVDLPIASGDVIEGTNISITPQGNDKLVSLDSDIIIDSVTTNVLSIGQIYNLPTTSPLTAQYITSGGSAQLMWSDLPIQSINYTSPIINTGDDSQPTIALQTSSVIAGSYTNTNLTVNEYGIITNATSNAEVGIVASVKTGDISPNSTIYVNNTDNTNPKISWPSNGITYNNSITLTTDTNNIELSATNIKIDGNAGNQNEILASGGSSNQLSWYKATNQQQATAFVYFADNATIYGEQPGFSTTVYFNRVFNMVTVVIDLAQNSILNMSNNTEYTFTNLFMVIDNVLPEFLLNYSFNSGMYVNGPTICFLGSTGVLSTFLNFTTTQCYIYTDVQTQSFYMILSCNPTILASPGNTAARTFAPNCNPVLGASFNGICTVLPNHQFSYCTYN